MPLTFQNTGQGYWQNEDRATTIRTPDGGGAAVRQTLSPSTPRPAGVPIICFDTTQVTSPGNYSNPKENDECHPLAASAHVPAVAFQSSQSGCREQDTHATLDANNGSRRQNGVIVPNPVAFESRFARNGRGAPSEIVPPIKAQSGQTGRGDAAPLTTNGYAVRRLTVVEVARLQGFEDCYCHIETNSRRKIDADEAEYLMGHGLRCWQEDKQWFTKIAADGPMYRAFGNSMAVPVIRWIGKRIQGAEDSSK